jgi:chromosome segregation ATPase
MSEPKDFEKLLREQVKATTDAVQESFDAVGIQMAQYASLIQELSERMARQDARIAEQDARIAEQDARIAEQDARIAEQDARIAEQDARILELENPRSKYRSL